MRGDLFLLLSRRLFRLVVRMSPLHGEDMGSNPIKDKNIVRILENIFVFYALSLDYKLS